MLALSRLVQIANAIPLVDTVGSKSLLELRGVKLVVTVEVHLLENSSQGTDAHSSLLLDGQLELEVQFSDHDV